jgi:hypothetical protein
MMQQQEEYRTELVANLTGCWQPSVMDCIRNLNRSKRPLFREATGEKFGIHPPVDLTRISRQVLELLLALLMDLPGAILCCPAPAP